MNQYDYSKVVKDISKLVSFAEEIGVEDAIEMLSREASRRRFIEKDLKGKQQGPIPLKEYDECTGIEELDLGIAIYLALKKNGIHTIKQLSEMTMVDMVSIRGISSKRAMEIKSKLALFGIKIQRGNK